MRASRTASAAKLVVVIDDDPLVREATGMLLRSWGCRVVTAESYDDAVTRLAASEAGRRPDLIVCDYHLSKAATGIDAVKRLRSAFEIPALLITGDASSPPSQANAGSYHLLHKPVNAEAFRAALVDARVLQR
jgi:CheY-like chemotaxis protein